jgi:hypothetical protein
MVVLLATYRFGLFISTKIAQVFELVKKNSQTLFSCGSVVKKNSHPAQFYSRGYLW